MRQKRMHCCLPALILKGRSPLDGSLTVHAGYLFLEELANVDAATLQRGGEKAIGDAKHLRVKVKVLDLKDEEGEAQSGGIFCCGFFWVLMGGWGLGDGERSQQSPHLFKRFQPSVLAHSSHVLQHCSRRVLLENQVSGMHANKTFVGLCLGGVTHGILAQLFIGPSDPSVFSPANKHLGVRHHYSYEVGLAR